MSITAKTLSLYLRASKQYPRTFWGCMSLWPIGITLQDIVAPLIAARALNRLVEVGMDQNVSYVAIFAPYVLAFLFVAGIGQICIATSLVLLSKTEVQARQFLERTVYQHLLDQSLNFHNNTFSGSLVTQVNRFTSSYIQLMDTFVIALLEFFVKFFVAIGILAFFAPLIAGVMFAWTILFLIINVRMARQRTKYSRAAATADSKLTAHLADTLSNITAVKAFAGERAERSAFDKLSRVRGQKKYAAWIHAVRTGVLTAVMLILLSAMVLSLSVYGIATGSIDVGTLVLSQVYLTTLIAVLWGVSRITRNIEQALSDAVEMTEILDIEPSIINSPGAAEPTIKNGMIRFDDVCFTHDQAEAALFSRLSFTIKPGEHVGFVGPSGGGKTTITKLLLRFSDIDSGILEIDGHDIRTITQEGLRRMIAYVPQEPVLFHRSLADNIAYGKPDAVIEEIKEAAQRANAAEFIEQLPDGYNTLVGERGVKLSGGQRQRIAIARAMLKNAPILILDEATSALDSESEQLIQDALWKLMEGRTAIVIAHRLSTIQKMDRIIVLDRGTIVEQGTHRQLVSRKGLYATLWKHQSGGFLDD